MKVIKEGKRPKKWWAGMKIECPNCGHTVELEVGDEDNELWISAGAATVAVVCGCCKTHLTERRRKR